jgi:hypothetical protein
VAGRRRSGTAAAVARGKAVRMHGAGQQATWGGALGSRGPRGVAGRRRAQAGRRAPGGGGNGGGGARGGARRGVKGPLYAAWRVRG